MSFQDRQYAGNNGGSGFGGGGDIGQRILAFLHRSYPIGTYLGIRVKVHLSFIILIVIFMFKDRDPMWTIQSMGILFMSVLLHEFGHCLACRSVGGSANEILMWPLGGLAFCAPPRRPWPEFVTVAGGPLVNVVIGVVCALVLILMTGTIPISFWPASFGTITSQISKLEMLIAHILLVNVFLCVFNLVMVFYPFDGGRMVQIALWTKMGWVRSMRLACGIGMAGAIFIALVAIAVLEHPWIAMIAGFGFYACYQQKKQLQGIADYETGYESSYGGDTEQRPGAFQRRADERRERRQEKEHQKQADFQQEVDRILDKVHSGGLQSLSEREKRMLKKASSRERSP